MNVSSILGTKGVDVVTVDKNATLAEAAAALRDRGIGAVVVSSDGRSIEGILSERDVVRMLASHGAGALGRTVASAMTTEVTTCRSGDGVEHLMTLMTEHRIRHVPVADVDGGLAGIISIGDVVKARLRQLQSENESLHDYLHQGL